MDLTITRGDARTMSVPMTLNGAAWEIPVGATVRFTVKHQRDDLDSAAVIAKSTGAGIVAVADVATITIAPADTNSLAAKRTTTTLYYDVQVTGAASSFGPWTVATGRLTVVPDVSRTTP